MTVTRKIFLAIVSFVVCLAAIFVFLTYFVIKESFEVMAGQARGELMEELSEQFTRYYNQHGHSWDGIQQFKPDDASWRHYPEASIVLLSKDRRELYATGTANPQMIANLGLKEVLRADGQVIGHLRYYDSEVAGLSKLRLGIPISVTFLLLVSTIIFVLISLLIAYWVARRITAPLRGLIPAIDRLGQGELGTQAPVLSKDEYGKVAVAFNSMSSQLQRNEDVRRNLVADVAHELRTPLTIVRGKLDALQQSGSSIEPENLLPLQDELIRLSRLVDDLHLLSLAEARKLPLEKKPADIADLVQRVMLHVEPAAVEKRIDLTMENLASRQEMELDANRMTQVLLNLLVNAIRYTPEDGSIRVVLEDRREGDRSFLRIAVSDTGVGMEPEQVEHIFNRFYRTDEARARNSGGMGLGLAIAKEFVVAHHGILEVSSTLGQGTVFTVELPY
ncbi:sensor histidine kinase [Paenibacillus sp. NPDC057967]|uniref:sensor histidine kinase n=1 Tax=Paenibacillus sp. NPDC057967 TaxID=3346293 RepID=UPI0036DE5669